MMETQRQMTKVTNMAEIEQVISLEMRDLSALETELPALIEALLLVATGN